MTTEFIEDTCSHINRLPIVWRNKVLGGASVGSCKNMRLPGMTVCGEHACSDSTEIQLRSLAKHVMKLVAHLSKSKSIEVQLDIKQALSSLGIFEVNKTRRNK